MVYPEMNPMRMYPSVLLFLTLILGCQEPVPLTTELALGLPFKVGETKESVVFIAGYDEGNTAYYTNAKHYFQGTGMQVIDTLFSVNGIIGWLNANTEGRTEWDEIHIVSHSSAWSGMSLKTTKTGERITVKTLREARNGDLISRVKHGVTMDTKIIFHSCGLGENRVLLEELKTVLTAKSAPTVYATAFFNVFGGKFAGHYLAKPYYGFYPTAESPGPLQLSKELKAAYPEIQIDWMTALKTRREAFFGEAYTYTFNIPVDWEYTFEKTGDIPKLADSDALKDWISESPEMAELLLELNIPLEKYRWRSEIRGKKLWIKGKTTVVCVLAPLLQDKDMYEYRMPVVEDPQLYQIL